MSKSNQVTEKANQQMAAWFSQRPSFALMGEFSSGKSTLLNVLIGQQVLPAKITATKLPVIWITHGPSSACFGLTHEGDLHDLDSAKPDIEVWDKYLLVRMTLDAPILQHCDVIDTPGISDPRLASGSLSFIAEFIDFAIWCTAANQAWRQSEKAAWTALPQRLRGESILAVTRADQLAANGDLNKVVKRMTTEAAGLFREIRPIASRVAADASTNGQVTDPAKWRESCAEPLLAAIKLSINIAKKDCDARQPVSPPPATNSEPTNLRQENLVEEPQETGLGGNAEIGVGSRTISAFFQIEAPVTKNTVLATIGQARDVLLNDHKHDDAHARVLATCLSVNESDSLDYARLLNQVEQEIEDFAESAWCRLA